MPKTVAEKAREQIQRSAQTALKQRFLGMTSRQQHAVNNAATALTEPEFGRLCWLAFVKARRGKHQFPKVA